MYIKRIESNIKGGCATDLGEKTLIVGSNGAGKSTITNAVSLALAGFVPDVGGKDLRKEAALMALAPGGEGQLTATATLSTDEMAIWSTVGTQRSAKEANVTTPSVSVGLPLEGLRSVLVDAGDAKRRDFFTRAACRHLAEKDIHGQIHGALISKYLELEKRAKQIAGSRPMSAVDLHLLTAETVKQAKAAVDKDLKAATKLIESMTATAVTATDVETAEERAAELLAQLQAFDGDRQAAMQAAQHREKLAAAVQTIQRLVGEIQAIDARLGVIGSEQPQGAQDRQRTIAVLTALTTIAEAQAASGQPHCTLCAAPVDPQATAQRAQDVRAAAEAHLATLRETAAIDTERSDLLARRHSHMENYTRWTTHYQQLQQTAPAVAADDAEATNARDTARLAWQEAAQKAQRLRAQRENYQAVQTARAQRIDAEGESDVLGRLLKVCGEATETLLKGAIDGFGARVQKYLPKGDVFRLQLKPFKAGLERDGFIHTALSGAEWARVILAIGCVLAEDYDLAVLIPEERAYDPTTLAAMMRAMTKAPAQILLTSPIGPKGRTPKGWTIIYASQTAPVAPTAEKGTPAAPPATNLEQAPDWVKARGAYVGSSPETELDALWEQAAFGVPRAFKTPRHAWQWADVEGGAFALMENNALLERRGGQIYLYGPKADAVTDPQLQNNGKLPDSHTATEGSMPAEDDDHVGEPYFH